jgi:RND family efflux transporter MFP subunit
MPKKKLIILATIVVMLAGAGAMAVQNTGAFGATKKSTSASSAGVSTVSIEVVTAKMTEFSPDISYSASLEASEEGIVSSKISGKVVQLYFQNGQKVTQGATLAKLDETDIRNNIKTCRAQLAATESQLNSIQASAQKAQIGLEAAQRNYNRAKTLYDQQVIAKSDYDNAESALKSAQVDVQTSVAGVAAQRAAVQAAQANLDTLNDNLKYTAVVAPISGVVDGKRVEIVQVVSAGMVLAKVERISPIYADIEASQADLGFIKPGAKAEFRLSGDGPTVYSGAVDNIAGTADPASRNFTCKIKLGNENGMLKPGIFGSVKMASGENQKAIMLPVKTLGGSAGEYYVFLNQKGVARKQTVTTGEILEDSVEIKSGVKNGDQVICSNVATLQDGDAIKVVSE